MQTTDYTSPIILWFRSDLRLRDHPGVDAALKSKRPILPLYIWDEGAATRPLGAASKWWLHHSLKALDKNLRHFGSRLIIASGQTHIVLADLIKQLSVNSVICSKTFDPVSEENDKHLKTILSDLDVSLHRCNSGFLSEPGSLRTKDDKPYRVYTPYNRALIAAGHADVDYLSELSTSNWPAPSLWPASLTPADLNLLPKITPSGWDWSSGFRIHTPGEDGAHKALHRFLKQGLADYAEGRDRPDKDVTSRLSPHLRFGEISPRRILLELNQAVRNNPSLAKPAEKFRNELIWREFNYSILYLQPRLHEQNFRRDFDGFAWCGDPVGFRAWTMGETGYPLVDAGMKELWQTGVMHNRVRMVCASFLIKHLLIDWRRGEQWFWDCLLDADPASNPANWQWVAGSGADAAPYFRIFNPVSQAEKFDPDGTYRLRYVPGYRRSGDLFDNPAENAPYPAPVVDHAFARDRALNAYKSRGDSRDDNAD